MPDIQDQIKQLSSQLEDLLDRVGQPLKPYIPTIARFLIVVTFLEDALRITTQWTDQLYYLEKHRRFPWGLSHLFLSVNVLVSKKKKKKGGVWESNNVEMKWRDKEDKPE